MDELLAFTHARLGEIEPDDYHDLTACDLTGSLVLGSCTCKVPEMVRRDIAAKQRILDEHQPGHPGPGGRPGCAVCDIGARSCGCMGSGHYPCLTVRLLALPYASHPEYRKEWRP